MKLVNPPRHLVYSLAAIAALGFPAQAQAPLDVRIALVIGNSAYASAPLINPANDARAMSETLRGLGFTVVELRDAQKGQMADAIAKVCDSLKGKQGVGMLYDAGHGLQLDWQHYMVPVDARMGKAADVPEQAVNINSVIDAFKGAGNRMNILVLDACRDNPFAGTASGKGLAQLDAPPGTFLAYATAPGNVAEDGDAKGGNGLYTQYLLEELKKPVAKIEDVFKRVRFNVRQKSQGRQIPWESTSLEDDFFFNTGKVVAVAKLSSSEKEKAFDVEKTDWDRVKDSKSPDDFYTFLKKYPSGLISEVAQASLDRLQKVKTVAVANKAGILQTVGEARYRLGDEWETRVIDGFTKNELRRGRGKVTSITADRVEVNNGSAVFTPEGGTIRNSFIADLSPPRQDLPVGEYSIGKKWSFRSIQTSPKGDKFWVEGTGHVAALEDVTVPAGTFKTYRVEVETMNKYGSRAVLKFWMDPNWGVALKTHREISRGGRVPDFEIFELMSLKRGPA